MHFTLLLLSEVETEARTVALEAAREAFPEAPIRVIDSWQAALSSPPAEGTELLVLSSPDPAEPHAAFEARDETGLPRWAVVVLGTSVRPGEIAVPREDWNPRSVARALRWAVTQHALRRENGRARGDLKTISRRLHHDLRAQVGGILTTTEAMREAMADGISAAHLQPVIDSTEEMMQLIDRISFVIRASTNPKPKEPLDMGMACWGAIQRLEKQILKRHAILVQSTSWPQVEGVLSWLETVWWNLLANALQHGGKPPRIELGWRRDGNVNRFWVQDGGHGVAHEMIGLLFHPFHRLHESDAPNGLGLSIVRRLVELQGGACGYERVESLSRFFFTLPDPQGHSR